MTATKDLHDIADRLDGVLHGALWPTSIRCSTASGRACDELVEQLRARLYAAWSENCTLRARVTRLAADNEGQRAMNAQLTEEAEERRQESLDRDLCT
jgi:hypothetical protein